MNPPELVGRTQEKDRLATLLQRAQQSRGQVALVVGEAGIGKTRLLVSLISLARANDFVVIRGECSEQDQDFPYGPIIDGLRTHFSTATTDEIQRITGPFRRELVHLLPEMALWIESVPATPALEPEAEKRRLFEVLVQIYQRLAAAGLLLIFEDIHWSDANSLEFFQTLTRRIGNLPILVALSSRPAAPNDEVAKLRLYLDRADNAQSITLDPLTETEIEALAKAALQTNDALHPALLESLTTLTQGNPLYTEQLVYMWLQKRQINLVNGTWMITSSTNAVEIPTTITQTVEHQMERLSEPAKRVLQFAAVAGRQFELHVLAQLTDFEDAQLIGLIKELIHRRFLEEVSRDRFAFRHALLRQAIYDGLLIRERQVLHQSLLRMLEGSASLPPDTRLAELSYHAFQAQAWEAARHYGFQAGQHALLLHSPRAAVEHFSHAVEAAGRLADRTSWELFMQRGRALDNLGEFQQALGDYESALHIAEDAGDQGAGWQTLIALGLLWASRDYGRAEAYCRRALQEAQAMGDPRLIGHSLNRMGNWYLNTGQPFEALDYHRQALVVFEKLGDLPGKGETLDLLGMTSGHVLQLQDQLAYYREAVEIFRTLDDPKALASALANLALCTLDPALAQDAIDTAHRIGWYSGEAYACVTAGYVHSFYGHFARSLAYFHHGQVLAHAIDHSQWLAGVQVFSGFVYLDLLELETAAGYVGKGMNLAAAVGSHWYSEMGRGLLAQIRLAQGRLDEAAELLAQRQVPDPPAMQHLLAMMAETELALARGDAQAALSSNERLRRVWPIDCESIPLSPSVTVSYLKTQARAMAILARPADALGLLQRARHIAEQAGLLPSLWQVEVLLGQIAASQDEKTAQEAFQRARACIDRLAENVPADLRQRFLQHAEQRISWDQSPDRRSGSHRGGRGASPFQLTRREMDIVREVATGKSNQQIADALHITVKTVETHLTRVLSKLNLASRTQVALWAAEHPVTPPSQ